MYTCKRLQTRLDGGLHASLIRRPGCDSKAVHPENLCVPCAARFSQNHEIQSRAPNNNGTEWPLLGACSATATRTESRSVGGVGSCDDTTMARGQCCGLPCRAVAISLGSPPRASLGQRHGPLSRAIWGARSNQTGGHSRATARQVKKGDMMRASLELFWDRTSPNIRGPRYGTN